MRDDDFEFWDVSDEVYNAIRAAELAAEGAALRASARAALMHRVALALLGVSLLLSIAMLLLPVLRPWSGQAVWVLILGACCYLLVVAVAYFSRPAPSTPEMRELLQVRHQMAALYVELQRSPGTRPNPVLLGVLADKIKQLDEQLVPALQELLNRRANLQRELRRYERREIRAPAPEMLARLQRMLQRINAAIDECLQQAANAYATLVALLQTGNDEDVANRAREWAEGLTTLYDALIEVLHGADDLPRNDAEAERTDPEPPDPRPSEPDIDEPAPVPVANIDEVDRVFLAQVEDARRRVRDRDLRRLTRCGLINRLPCTIAAKLHKRRNGEVGQPTSLEQAQALREILIAAVERLRPSDGSPNGSNSAMDRYNVLYLLYIEGRPANQVAHMLDASPRTAFRWRSDAVLVLARDLGQRESRCCQGGHDPPAH